MCDKPEPTQDEIEMAKARLETLDRLSPLCKWELMEYEIGIGAALARQRWNVIMAMQQEFENKYY